jgi:NADH-quinone oxidoreductase subunit L
MNTNLAYFTFISSFIGFLFNVFFGKHRKISFWDHWNPCCFFLASAYFFGAILLIPGIQISLFDWIQISNFKVDFGFY